MAEPARLAPEQHRTLARLIQLPELRGFHLVGGSAVAWHLGHRTSRDLDLFSDEEDADLDRARAALAAALPDAEVVSATDMSLRIRAGGTEIDIVRYPHATLEAPSPGPNARRCGPPG